MAERLLLQQHLLPTTEPLPIVTPSSTTTLAPINTSSSTITGFAEGGSITPARTVPAPI